MFRKSLARSRRRHAAASALGTFIAAVMAWADIIHGAIA